MSVNQQLRDLPSVEEILRKLETECPRDLLVGETRRALDSLRQRLRAGEPVDASKLPDLILTGLEKLEEPSLRRVINATGVILHTNLGRAPLPETEPLGAYSNLEYDLERGSRGRRDSHIGGLLERLTGKQGTAVNNNAAAVYLALNELASGGEVIVSRGELIEIGDGFRIPDIMVRSGAILREVGTTNRTRIEDYREALSDRTRLIMRVHPSNFHITGFTGKPELKELAELSAQHGIPLYEDLGSGCLRDLKPYGIDEPVVSESLRAGVNLVSFSGDKLLGGPQCGLLAGDAELIARLRKNPMFRALRLDKLILHSLETTLRHTLFCRWDRIPALSMIMVKPEQILRRAQAFVTRLEGWNAEIIEGESVIGGGATPDQALPTWLIAITAEPDELEKKLRLGNPAVVARIHKDRLLIDLRTVLESEEDELAAALRNCENSPSPLPNGRGSVKA